MNSKVVNAIDLSYTAPTLPKPMIPRLNLISAIHQLFDSATETVCVEGRPGLGKTTLLRDFAEKCESPCFSVFLRPGSRHSYDPVLARSDLANQITWYLESRRLDDHTEPSDGQFRTLLNRCTRKLSRTKSNAYFVVDGLYHIPSEDHSLLHAIMALLPFEGKYFRFLFSSDGKRNIFDDHKILTVKPFVLTAFTSHETDEFLSDIIDDKTIRSELHNSLAGEPALLASVRRQFLAAPDAQPLDTLSLSLDLEKSLEAEWRLLLPIDESTELLLSFILAYGRPVPTATLSQYTGISSDRVKELLFPFHFLSSSGNLGGWEFSTEPFRQFVENKLRPKVRFATETIAVRLLEDPDSFEALTLLPQFLQRIENSTKILDWFDEQRFAKILLKNRTPASTEPVLRNAILLSHDAQNDRALTTYSLLRSVVPQISNITGIEHEIKARCVLGDTSGALAVANSAPLLTQRVRLLAVYVEAASDLPGTDVHSIKEDIRELVGQIDLDSLRQEETIEIAIDLYPTDPPLALRLLKSAIGNDEEEDSLEIALARITVSALRSKQYLDASATSKDSAPKTAEIMLDEQIRKFLETTQLALKAKTSDEILSLTSKISKSSERLFVLRKWIVQHLFEPDILKVVEIAVSEGISSLDFTPTATFYREVLTPLPYVASSAVRSKLVAMVDAQRPIIRDRGPTIDYVRTQLILAACNFSDGDAKRTTSQLEELYLDTIHGVDVLETRAACLAWCIAELHRFDPDGSIDSDTQFRALVEEEFAETISKILNHGAEQFLVVKGALHPLALFLPRKAFEIAKRLNTAERRNQAYFEIIDVKCSGQLVADDFPILFDLLDTMLPGPLADKAISIIGKAFVQLILSGEDYGTLALEFLRRCDKCAGSATKSLVLGRIAGAFADIDKDGPLLKRTATRLLAEFKLITNPRDRYTVGCELIVQLHKPFPTLATKIFDLFSEKNEVSRVSENVEEGSYYILDLVIKAMSALARSNLLQEQDVQRVRHMITGLPNPYQRIILLSGLAFFLWKEQQTGYFRKIVNEHLWTELLRLNDADQEVRYRAWVEAYGVVWLENRDRARSSIADFPLSVRIPAVHNLCFSILHKIPSDEPFDGRGKRTSSVIDYSDVHTLLALCEETEDDQTIFVVLEGIADQVTHTGGNTRFSKEQKTEFSRRMMAIAEEQLPKPNGIKHLGFQIVSKAQALRVANARKSEWRDIITSAENLSNSADRVFVLSLVASYLPARLRKITTKLLAQSESDTEALQAIEDRYQRYSTIAQVALDKHRPIAKKVAKKAFQSICGMNDGRNAIREQRLLDLAYSIDPDLPMKFAVLYDNDPAREEYRKRAQRQIARHSLKRELGEVKKDIALRERKNEPNLAAAAWQALGTLNAGRMIPVNVGRARDMLACASNYPLETAYPMYSWVLSNVMDKYSQTAQASQYIRDIFEGFMSGANFFFTVTGSADQYDVNPTWNKRNDDEYHAVINVGERDAGIAFLERWIEKNADDYVVVVDPYFGPSELWFVRLILQIDPHLTIRILTGSTDSESFMLTDMSDAYRSAWILLCHQDPPYTEIISVSYVDGGKTPIHDRWILSKSAGIRMGTSLNSLGNKLTEISEMTSNERERVEPIVNGYLARTTRDEGSERITYKLFELLP